MWLQVKDIAKIENVCRQTIHKRIKDGFYPKVKMTEGGHFRIWVDSKPELILYTRVSTKKQISSLETQGKILKEIYPDGRIVTDIGSGFNFERRGFNSILERSLNGVPLIIVATSKDRIARAGFPLIEKIIKLSGGRIETLDKEDESEEFNTDAFISFITSFISSYYGKRASNRRKNSNCNTESKVLPGE